MATIKEQYASNMVGYWDMRTGSVKDQSDGGNNGTFTGSPVFTNTRKGRALTSFATTKYVNIGDSANLKFTNEDWTIGWSFYYDSTSNLGFGKGTSSAITPYFFQVNQPSANKISFYIANSAFSAWLASNANFFADLVPNEFNQVVVVKSGTNAYMYVNGILGSTRALGSDTIGNNTNAFRIGANSTATGHLGNTKFNEGFVISGVALTNQEVSQLYEETQKEAKLTSIPEKTMLPAPQGDSNTVLHYSGKIDGSTLKDISGNGNNSTTNAHNMQGFTRNGLKFDGVKMYAQTSSNLDLSGTNKVSVSWLMKVDTVAASKILFELSDNFNNYNNAFDITLNANQKVGAGMCDGLNYSTIQVSSTSAGQWAHYVCVLDRTLAAGSECSLFVNSVEDSNVLLQTATLTGNFKSDKFNICARNAGSLYPDVQMADIRVYSTALTQAEINDLYNNYKKKLDFNQTGEDWNVTTAAVSSGLISNTGWTVNTTSVSVVDSGVEKLFSPATTGGAYYPIGQAFGEWRFKYKKVADAGSLRFQLITNSTSSGVVASGQTGYYIIVNTDETVGIVKMNGDTTTTVVATLTAGVSLNIMYEYKVTRTLAGLFTVYIRNLDINETEWTTVTSGTDTTYTTSSYLTWAITSGSDDQIGSFKLYPLQT